MMNIDFYEAFLKPVYSKKDSTDVAFCIRNKMYSYAQLYDVVEQIWHVVREIPEGLIGLYATDDIRTYASVIALWTCGKTYVPLNPNQPNDRHAEVMESVGSHYILSADKKYALDVEGLNMLRTKDVLVDGYVRKDDVAFENVSEQTLAYIIFTSGSTGKPKGVPISRGNVAAFIDSMNHIGLDITAADRCLQPFDLTFDFSVSGYVIPLAKGASIYTIPQKAIKFSYIAGLLEDHHLTVLQMVPSMVRNMLPYMDEVELGSVRYNIFCGEALTGKVLKAWHEANPDMVSYNMYGPTEDTVFCTYYKIEKSNIANPLASNDIVCIGKTFDNSGLLVLDASDKVVMEKDVEGELCLCGQQLTLGYWQNETENCAKFLEIDGTRYYRTGDLCYYGEDGNLMFVSRKDFQVKINGFRVELGEIENRYAEISGGRFSVVMPYTNEQDNTELAIVIEGEEYDYKEDKTELASQLPPYELPGKWLFTRTIPLNTNGKVDRKAIKKQFDL